MNEGTSLRQRAEARLFDAAMAFVPRLPRKAVNGFAYLAGLLAWLVDRRDRRIAMANLDLAFGAMMDTRQKRRIARQSFVTFARVGLDYFWLSRHTRTRYERFVIMEDSLRQWIGKGPALAVTAHYGNWEILGQLAALHGNPPASVAKPVRNPLINQRINTIRERTGQLIVPREGALKALVRTLKEGRYVALILDQDTKISEGGVFAMFFGVPVPMSGAAAALAVKLSVPIVPVFCRRDNGGHYCCYARAALMPDAIKGLSVEEITQQIAGLFEEEVRRDPGQWLWMYKRWKRRMPGFDPSRYPFYADC